MKSFEIEYKNEVYICEFNRHTLKILEEREGLNFNDNKPLTMVSKLFYGSLLKNHPTINKQFAFNMLDELTTPNEDGESEYSFTELSEALVELAKPCYSSEGIKAKKSIKK